MLNNVNEIDSTILNKTDDESFKDDVNLLILNATIDFVLSANKFNEPLCLL